MGKIEKKLLRARVFKMDRQDIRNQTLQISSKSFSRFTQERLQAFSYREGIHSPTVNDSICMGVCVTSPYFMVDVQRNVEKIFEKLR